MIEGIPFGEIRTVFLDAGNTLVSMDFAGLREALQDLGLECSDGQLERAEAAARPGVSRALTGRKSTEHHRGFVFYLASMLRALPAALLQDRDADALARRLAENLYRPGANHLLWRRLMPGVRDALEAMGRLGLRRIVVSNSDGTAANSLAAAGIDQLVDLVVDSHLVGVEKPDPAIFRHALERAGATAHTTLHVGDMYYADVAGARSAGIHGLLLDPYGDWPDVDCPRLPDLAALAACLTRAADGI